jgi:predicted transcriptional regulator
VTTEPTSGPTTITLATELTIAWLGNPNTRASAADVPAFLTQMHDSVAQLVEQPSQASVADVVSEPFIPAVSPRKSLASKDHILSLINGKPYKTLRRHLSLHGLTPEQYRERYNLKPDYPMTAEAYSTVRRAQAKRIGLGRKSVSDPLLVEPTPRRRKLKLPMMGG